MAKEPVREKLEQMVKQLVEEAKKTGQIQSIELIRGTHYVIQLLITPPGEVAYGATTARRTNPGVLLSIRSAVLWRNNLTIPSPAHFEDLKKLIDSFVSDKELYEAVKEVMTPTAVREPVRVIKL